MARNKNGEHHRTSRVERFEIPKDPNRTKDNMFDFVVKGAQKDFAEKNAKPGN
jgi:hypothetical protein